MKNDMRTRLKQSLERAAEWRVLLALLFILFLRIGFLRGIVTPERRRIKAHWIGSQRRPVRPLRPVDLLFPVMAGEITIFACAAQSTQPVYLFTTGNILLVALAMLPIIFRHRTA